MTSGTGARAERWIRVRLVVTAVVLCLGFSAIAYKAWALQIRDGASMRKLGHSQYLKDLEIPAPRGSIHDRTGVELAITVDGPSVAANPREVVDVARTADLLAAELKLDVRAVEEKLGSRGFFTWIDRRVSEEEAKRITELKLPGVRIVPEPRRFYPARGLAGPLLGLVNIDGHGLEGLELALEEHLRGRHTSLPALRDARGQMVLADGWDEPDAAGATVTLTMDRFIQFSAERALKAGIEENEASAGIVMVLEPKTGEVLALATWPTFDPNDPRGRKDARNRAVTDAFEPGSTMKVFNIAAAVDAGVITKDTVFDIEGGRMMVSGHQVVDTHLGEHLVDVTEIMKVSSNVGAVKIARKLGKDGLYAALKRFGFGAKTGIELPGERSGLLREPKRWGGELGLASMSYGYGMVATPLQIAAALSAVANGGVYNAPTLVKRIVGADGKVIREHRPENKRIMRAETAEQMTFMLRTVLEKGGTAEKLAIPGFVAAGKTGTAKKVDPTTGKYFKDRYLASFMGFVPADDPRLAIVVMIDDPKGKVYYGGLVAGPVFSRIAEESLKYLGVAPSVQVAEAEKADKAEKPPKPEKSAAARVAAAVDSPPEAVSDLEALDELPPAGPNEPIVMIPDFTGMSMGQAIAAARAAGVKVELEGTGRASGQFPAPGRAMKSVTCRVTFDPG